MNYDPFQQQAIAYINEGHSVLVSAPTGAGKTAIAEYVITDCLAKGTRLIYTAPIKALSNQKYRDFHQQYGDKIGILTGDVSINPSAPVLIMTTEIFRNKLLENKASLDTYSWIIFDEIHYLDDYQRGTVWEESLIFLPEHMRVLGLSATVPNVDAFAQWITAIHPMPLKVVKEVHRPVPLHFFYQCQGNVIDNLHKLKHMCSKKVSRYGHFRPNRPAALVKHLQKTKRLPCIYFVFGRKRCEYLAHELTTFDFLTTDEKQRIQELYDRLCDKFELSGDRNAVFLRDFIEKGIAYHHAGMLPTLKEVVEQLFTSKLIKVIFTTETFALGINMPARTVIFDELRKFYGTYHSILKTRDFYQMAGRAGRRGIDHEGFVYSRINPRYISYRELKQIIYSEPEAVRSKFNASYATVLNLYGVFAERLYDIYPRSFHYFQQKQRLRQKALELLRAKVSLLKELAFIKDAHLTEKGNFASKIYGYELLLAEPYATGMLEELTAAELATLALALVHEPRKGSTKPRLNKKIKTLCTRTDAITSHIYYMENKFRIRPLSKRYHYHLTPALEAWMGQEPFEKVMRYTDADEGEVIRYFRMGIQILREILETSAAPALKENARKAVEAINRDIIDAERQLRR
jgi:superfamily II RNA helicase